jgi:hypothetical protein
MAVRDIKSQEVIMITLGGVAATPEQVAQVLDALYDAPGDQMRQYLEGTPLEGMDYQKVHDEEIAKFPKIRVPPGTRQHHVAHVRPACIHAMQRLLGEAGWNEGLKPLPKLSLSGSHGGPGFDPIASRRTAKRYYGENLARMWAEKEFAGAVVENVGDRVPKLGYDVLVILADASEVHIEAKYSHDASVVILTDNEREHVQKSGCTHEHVLYVVSDAQAVKLDDDKWHCTGGTNTTHRNWTIDEVALTPVTSWRYKVPDASGG